MTKGSADTFSILPLLREGWGENYCNWNLIISIKHTKWSKYLPVEAVRHIHMFEEWFFLWTYSSKIKTWNKTSFKILIILFYFILFFKLNRVVSYACYPSFWKHHLDPPGENHCYVSSEYGQNYTNGPCPNDLEKSNRLYRCGSHYRVSSKVSSYCALILSFMFSPLGKKYLACLFYLKRYRVSFHFYWLCLFRIGLNFLHFSFYVISSKSCCFVVL